MNEKETETVNQNINISASDTLAPIIETIEDAVMTIEVTTLQGQSLGSGFVYKTDDTSAYLLTNNHVVEDAREVIVTNNNGESTEAEVLGTDELSDLAVLKISKEIVTTVAKLGDSTSLKVGDTIMAIGTPIAKEYFGTVSDGIVSGLNRQVTTDLSDGTNFIMDVIQITAAINPGNSGGPLINMQGEVVGINTLKLVEDEIEGMGFAIPIEMAISIIDKLEQGIEIQRPLIGISVIDANNDYALEANKIELDEIYNLGIVVIDITRNSTAEKYGLKENDVITKVNDIEIEDSLHFKYILYKYSIGDTINIEINRDGKTQIIEMTLENSL